MKDFTSQQKEIVARKLGYDGPMQGFDEFIASSPALEARYAAISGKFSERMAKGGLVKMKPKGYAYGGPVYTDEQFFQQTGSWTKAAELRDKQNQAIAAATTAASGVSDKVVADWWSQPANQKKSDSEIKDLMDQFKVTPDQFSRAIGANTATTSDIKQRYFDEAERDRVAAANALAAAEAERLRLLGVAGTAETERLRLAALAAAAETERLRLAALAANNTGAVSGGGNVTFSPVGGTPQAAAASQIKPEKIIADAKQNIDTAARAGKVETITDPSTPGTTTLAADIDKTKVAETVTADTSAAALKTALDKVAPADGTLTAAATIKPEEQWTTAITAARKNLPQIETAQKVAVVPERTLGAAETVAGSAVDMTKVATELAKAEAATGTVTEDMTVQGQLAKLTKDFDATNPPSWASGALRAVTAEMSARGLGASSLAGAALVQAALEKALPIASADAAIFQQMATQNLSNRQQIAVLTAQQRAAFLGQEFDQNFQTRVINAARVADIANLNFNAKQQVALENARLAQTVDLANLSGRQASFMAELAQTATLETTNLNNRQQAAVENAKAALQIDLTNMSYEQQSIVLKTQLTAQAILSDTAATNAAKQFNASSKNQTVQFFAGLASQVSQFNASQSNAMEQFKVDQSNSVKRFNAEVTNQREQFNATQRLVIDQSNAQWQREIATINTGAINTINLSNAQLAQQMTLTEYNNEIQMYRDAVTHAWQSSENDANRTTTLAAAELAKSAQLAIADATTAAANARALGELTASVVGKTSIADITKAGTSIWDWLTG
jgi:translation initiation factor 1 (eIF-1/SUI1)